MRIGKKAWMTGSIKTDGRCNVGKVVGVDLIYEGLGFITEKQFISSHVPYRYKVAYVDVFTKRAISEWVHKSDVSFVNPELVESKQ